jgi:hypothetical protein
MNAKELKELKEYNLSLSKYAKYEKRNLDLKPANVKGENTWLWIVFLLSIVYFWL